MCSALEVFLLRASFFVAPSLRLRFFVLGFEVCVWFFWPVDIVVSSGCAEEAIVFVNVIKGVLPWLKVIIFENAGVAN